MRSRRGGGVEERGFEEEEEERERYITSKLVRLEVDQTASRVINRRRGALITQSIV